MHEDAELLHRYVSERSETAFKELVERHIRLVYSIALRKVGSDPHLAEEVVQLVFTAIAQQADSLHSHPAFVGWLFTTTRFTASKVSLQEVRRQRREDSAVRMSAILASDTELPDSELLRPLLDDLVAELPDTDREALVIRFFEGKSIREIGRRLDLSEDGARSRVARALEKLHGLFLQRGIRSSAEALGALLATQASAAVPSGLGAAVSLSAIAHGGAATVSGAAAVSSIFMSTTKTGIAIATLSLGLLVGVWWNLERRIAAIPAPARAEVGTKVDIPLPRADDAKLAADLARSDELKRQVDLLRAQIAGQPAGENRKAIASLTDAAQRAPRFSGPVTAPNTSPVRLSASSPDYPEELRARGVGGLVRVQIMIQADGSIIEPRIVFSGNPALNPLVLDAVRTWRYSGGAVRGRPVTFNIEIPILFSPGLPTPIVQSDSKEALRPLADWIE